MKKLLNNEQETIQFAKELAECLKPNMTVLLEGDLGAGKTTFSKGVAAGLGIERVVKSPTYTLIREYQEGKLPLFHMDLYRLEETGAEELGLDEYFESGGVCLVEWASFAMDDMPDEYLTIHLKRTGENEFQREAVLEAKGAAYEKMLEGLANGR